MPDEREQKYLSMIEQFPESPLGYFTLGKYYVEVGRHREAVAPLERCLAEDPEWSAAVVALADAYAGCGERQRAIDFLQRARSSPLAQSHPSLAEEIDDRLEELE